MYDSIDKNNPFDKSSSTLDMGLLTKLIGQQARCRPVEDITILGCGYVGSALADYWQDQGHFVTGTTTSREKVASLSNIASKVVLIKADDINAVHSLLEGQDTLVVSVAPTGSHQADEATYEATYVNTAKNLVTALNQAPNVKQVIYLSSCSVYEDRQGEWVDETAQLDQLDYKSQVIYAAEKIILQAANAHRKVCILRLGGIYGPNRELVGMFGGLAGMTMPGKGDRFINWIHRDDIIGAIDFARSNELDGVYNLVDDSQLTIKEQVKLICSRYDLPPVQWDSSKLSYQRKNLQVSNQKLKAAGYNLIHPQLLV
jgi:nucleoside-diphosphate-sugar epimerase